MCTQIMSMIKHTVYIILHAPVLTYTENYFYAKECWVFGEWVWGALPCNSNIAQFALVTTS